MLDRLEKGFDREKHFTSDAAHELLTPLASILNQTEVILRKERTTDQYKDGIEQLHNQAEKASDMVQLLLQLSRVESGILVDRHEVDMSEVILSQKERLTEVIKQKKLHVLIAEADPGSIRMNISHAEQIVFNLIHNAIKYTPEGGSITISWTQNEHLGKLIVKDSGIGFTKEAGNRLFDRFYRSDDSQVQSEAGSGLGLSLVRAIVTFYGGSITAESEGPGKGSRFTVYLTT